MNKLRYTVCLFIILIAGKVSFAQSPSTQSLLDSSRQVIHLKSTSDSLVMLAYHLAVELDEYWGQFNAFVDKGKIHDYHYEPDSSYYYYNEALRIAEIADNQSDIIFIPVEIAFIEERLGRRNEAIETLEKVLKLSIEIKDSINICQAYASIGYFHSNGGNHEKSVEYNLKALEIAEKNYYEMDAANASQGIGIIYNKQKDYDKVEHYFTKALKVYTALKDTSRMLGIYNDFGILNKNKGNFSQSEKEYLKMLDIASSPNYYWVRNFAHNNLGNLYFHMQLYDKGIENSTKGAEYSKAAGDMRSESDGLNNLARNQLAIGLLEAAVRNATRSLEFVNRQIKVDH